MVCFVILHYMALDETIHCVDSILNNIDGQKKVIIVDNASPNNSFKGLEEKYKDNSDVDLIFSETNEGFARGNNIGYKLAVEKYNPDFIVVMNNDMEIKQLDFIDKIYKSFEEYAYSIMGPDIYSTKKKYHQNPQTRKVPSKEQLKKNCKKMRMKLKLRFLIYLKHLLAKKTTVEDEIASYANRPYVEEVREDVLLHGSCYVFSKTFIEKHKDKCFFDKTFMYLEAEILYYLAINDNEKMIYYPELKVDHHEDVSTDAVYKDMYKKSIFSLKCLLQSSEEFVKLIDDVEKRA